MSKQTLENSIDSNNQLQASGSIELVAFRVSNQEYAVPIASVQEIILCQAPTRIPNAPTSVEGIINLRGKIIPIVNSHTRLGIEDTRETVLDPSKASVDAEERIIILQVEEQTVGFVVDGVSEVLNLETSNINQPPQDNTQSRFVTGIGKYNDRLLILLDPSKIISTKDAEQISATSASL